jgi:HAMP domain-containing protein
MGRVVKRRKFLIHPSSQLKFIAMSTLPALVVAVFCLQVLFVSVEFIVKKEKQNVTVKASEVNYSVSSNIEWLMQKKFSNEVIEKTGGILKELISLEDYFQKTYYDIISQWTKIKMRALLAIALTLIIVGFMSLIYSHRIAGSLYRLGRDMDSLAAGKDIPPVRLRKYDEFKELAASLEKIRKVMKENGLL